MKKILSAIAIMALMIVFASCTNSRKDGGASLYEPDNGMIEDGTSSQFDYESYIIGEINSLVKTIIEL